MQTGIRLIGNGQAPIHKYWEHLLKLIQEDKIKPLNMVTHRFDVSDLETKYTPYSISGSLVFRRSSSRPDTLHHLLQERPS